jgi:hypothetical protein
MKKVIILTFLILFLTSFISAVCTDTDTNELIDEQWPSYNIYEKGTTTGTNEEGDSVSETDYCVADFANPYKREEVYECSGDFCSVFEFACLNYEAGEEQAYVVGVPHGYACPGGCEDGACKGGPEESLILEQDFQDTVYSETKVDNVCTTFREKSCVLYRGIYSSNTLVAIEDYKEIVTKEEFTNHIKSSFENYKEALDESIKMGGTPKGSSITLKKSSGKYIETTTAEIKKTVISWISDNKIITITFRGDTDQEIINENLVNSYIEVYPSAVSEESWIMYLVIGIGAILFLIIILILVSRKKPTQ